MTSYIHEENIMKYSMYSTHFRAETKSSKGGEKCNWSDKEESG